MADLRWRQAPLLAHPKSKVDQCTEADPADTATAKGIRGLVTTLECSQPFLAKPRGRLVIQ
jgi:hypothetical protein